MTKIVISGTGIYTPKNHVSNEELIEAFNTYVREFNEKNRKKIENGEVEALLESSPDFIVKASGIKHRYFMDKKGVLDSKRMRPYYPDRGNDEPSIQCEMAVDAAKKALQKAGKKPEDVDLLIISCSAFQRAYPSMAIEVQKELGTGGFAYDMSVACSSSIFGIQNAYTSINSGLAKCALVISPEICAGHINFKDRQTHFIFGDACSAVVLENAETATSVKQFEILGMKLITQFSNNIRNNFGYLNPGEVRKDETEYLCIQKGRRVFKEVIPLTVKLIQDHLDDMKITSVKRFWLHQANKNMNDLILKYLLKREASEEEAPLILDKYGNTSSAGLVIAFDKYSDDFNKGEKGILCGFGAGYSAGCISIQRV
ncbi:MAG: beta-ketoacyl-ACP synthase III [Epsilonproteobacteria bacterium]|nr:MAG: beta-ketoacyl-ACP synthase III [Campylobacterota bacterium]